MLVKSVLIDVQPQGSVELSEKSNAFLTGFPDNDGRLGTEFFE